MSVLFLTDIQEKRQSLPLWAYVKALATDEHSRVTRRGTADATVNPESSSEGSEGCVMIRVFLFLTFVLSANSLQAAQVSTVDCTTEVRRVPYGFGMSSGNPAPQTTYSEALSNAAKDCQKVLTDRLYQQCYVLKRPSGTFEVKVAFRNGVVLKTSGRSHISREDCQTIRQRDPQPADNGGDTGTPFADSGTFGGGDSGAPFADTGIGF